MRFHFGYAFWVKSFWLLLLLLPFDKERPPESRVDAQTKFLHTPLFGGWMTDCAMHFPLCTHLSDSHQHCFCADIAFVYLLLSDVCRYVRDAVVALTARVSWNVGRSMEMLYFKWIFQTVCIGMAMPCRGGEILLIFCDAGNGCWSCAHDLLSSASTIIIETICLGFNMMMISTRATHSYWNPMILFVFFGLAGNHMEIPFATWPRNKRRKITIIMICINFCFIYCYKLQAIKLPSHNIRVHTPSLSWCTPEAAAVWRFSISCPLFILIYVYIRVVFVIFYVLFFIWLFF